MKRTLASLLAGLVTTTALTMTAPSALAHTESDLVAIPAGSAATVTLKPTHGCGDAATIGVRTRVPIADAQATPVDGWTHTATPDDDGNVVLEWTGGLLPADQSGAFPVTFTTPDTVGELLTFPFIQTCEAGAELAWIDGDPQAEYPAPRVLVLAAGAQPAATIDDVPLDAPGRDLLTAVADVDNPATPTTVAPTTAAPTTAAPTTAAPSTTAAPDTTAAAAADTTAAPATTEGASATTAESSDTTEAPTTTAADSEDDGGGNAAIVVIGLVIVAAALGALVYLLRRRARQAAGR